MTRNEETTLLMAVVWIGQAMLNIQQERLRDVAKTQTIWTVDSQRTLLRWVGELGQVAMARDPYHERRKPRKKRSIPRRKKQV
jgi:hypothetical protein